MKRSFKAAIVALCLLAPMRAEATISFVQSATAFGNGGADAATASTTWTSGNLLVVALGDGFSVGFYGYSHFCGDGGTNTFNLVASYSNGGNSPPGSIEIWAAYNITGGTRAVTCSSIGGGGYISIRVMEFSGIATSPLDQQNALYTSGTNSFTSPSVTTTQNDELLVGTVNYTASGFTATGGAGWTDLGEVSSGSNTIESSYQIVSATGTYAYSGTGSNNPTMSAIATFKASAGGGATCGGRLALLGAGGC